MAGRKIKVLANNKKNFTKEEKEQRKNVESLASDGFKKLQKTAPNHLNSVAKNEYKRIVTDLNKLPLRNLDRVVLENYCTWYAIYKDIDIKLNKIGYTIENEEGEVVANPLIKTLERATSNIKSCAAQLGLTVDSRMKMFLPKEDKKEESLFDKFG